MAPSNFRSNNQGTADIFSRMQPGIAFVVMIFGALIAFEVFNYSTTDHALRDLLGDLEFAGISWATILAFAFCGIDFAGISRLFTPEQGAEEPKEVWYLFGAWLLAATMNAILTWWGVSIAVANHTSESSAILDAQTVNSIVPVFVAIMVWVIRILIIGTLSLAMDRLVHPGAEQRTPLQNAMSSSREHQHQHQPRVSTPPQTVNIPTGFTSSGVSHRNNSSSPRSIAAQPRPMRGNELPVEPDFDQAGNGRNARPDPTYHTLTAAGRSPLNRPGGSGEGGGNSNGSGPNNNQRRF
jgi:hypothetical protein